MLFEESEQILLRTFRVNAEFLRPYFFQTLGRMLPQLVGLVISMVMVSTAGLDGFGIYSLAMALVAMSFGCMGGALDVVFQRDNRSEDLATVVNSKVFGWCCWLPVVLVIAGMLEVGLMLVAIAMLGVMCQQLIESWSVARRIAGQDSKAVLPRLMPVAAVLIALLLLRPVSPTALALCFLAGWALFGVAIFFRVRNVSFGLDVSIKKLTSALPIWASLILTQVYGNADLYLIRAICSEAEVGAYKLAYTFAGAVVPIAGVLSVIYLSKISEAAIRGDPSLFKATFFQQLRVSGVLGALFIVFVFTLFPPVIELLYSGRANAAILPAQILSIAMLMNVVMMVFSYALLALNLDRIILYVTAVTALLYVLLAYLFVESQGLIGAPIAMCLAYGMAIIIFSLIFARKNLLTSLVNKRT